MLPSDHPNAAKMKDGLACWVLPSHSTRRNRTVQAEVWFAAAAALEPMLLAAMFTKTDVVAQLASLKRPFDKHQGDFGSCVRKEMDLGKLLEMAKEVVWFRPSGVSSLLTKK